MNPQDTETKPVDVVLIGAGVMSATLAMFLHKLQPDWKIEVYERLDQIAAESSDAWNNAGTGHAAFCELNYTHEREDGSIDCTKAFKIDEQFEVSKQFWAHLVEQNIVTSAADFIQPIPHMSFVRGEKDVVFLKKRHQTLTKNHLFEGMMYSEDPSVLRDWFPIMMENRDPNERVAATRMDLGTDVNFGALSRQIFDYLDNKVENTTIYTQHEVHNLVRDESSADWHIIVKDLETDQLRGVLAKFVFIGAGGGALWLLEKSDIPEASGYGGFPVSGQWLRCTNEEIINRHHAKVYGKAAVGTPPMSVPHLDTRIINGKPELLFGPFAGFSTKFLKHGSYLDLFRSIEWDNIVPMIRAGIDNMPLTQYLLEQVRMSPEEKLEELKAFFPSAKLEDWEIEVAGQRVQVIKKDAEKGGVLEFGTEIVHAADGSVAALLGASPGASTAVAIMLDLLRKCFPEHINTTAWQTQLKTMIPSYSESLAKDKDLCEMVRNWTTETLGLKI